MYFFLAPRAPKPSARAIPGASWADLGLQEASAAQIRPISASRDIIFAHLGCDLGLQNGLLVQLFWKRGALSFWHPSTNFLTKSAHRHMPGHVSEHARGQASEQAIEQAGERANERTSKHVTAQASELTSDPTSEQARGSRSHKLQSRTKPQRHRKATYLARMWSKQASKQAIEQASKQVRT